MHQQESVVSRLIFFNLNRTASALFNLRTQTKTKQQEIEKGLTAEKSTTVRKTGYSHIFCVITTFKNSIENKNNDVYISELFRHSSKIFSKSLDYTLSKF